MDLLQQFYDNHQVRDAVQSFFSETLKDMALKDLFDGKDAYGYPEANKVVERVFIKLKELYEPTPKANVDNQAR